MQGCYPQPAMTKHGYPDAEIRITLILRDLINNISLKILTDTFCTSNNTKISQIFMNNKYYSAVTVT